MKLLEEYYETSKKTLNTKPVSKQILFEIIDDLTDRRGLRQEWDQIDDDIQNEILSDWLKIIETKSNDR
ncbi:MAG: hypothetical protein ACYSQZ_09610 [Planctomycetota bacterium]